MSAVKIGCCVRTRRHTFFSSESANFRESEGRERCRWASYPRTRFTHYDKRVKLCRFTALVATSMYVQQCTAVTDV